MKKIERILTILMISMFIFSIFSIGRVFASSDSLKITDATIYEKSSGVEASINSFNNDSIDSSIKYHKINDHVVYKIKLKNVDSEKHIIDVIVDNNSNKSLQYDYDNYKNTIIEPGSEIEIYIKESYVREYSNIDNRNVKEKVKFTFNLIDDEKKESIIDIIINPIINPETVDNVYIYFIISGISLALLSLIVIKNKNKTGVKFFVTLTALTLISLPIASYALESNDNIEFESSISFYDKLKVTYDNDGEKTVDIINYGKKIKRQADPKKEGYTFKGWYLGDMKFDFDTIIDNDITLKAKYEKNTFNVTYNLNNGIAINPTTIKTPELPVKLSNPYKLGYTFTGWTGSNGDVPSDNVSITEAKDELEYTANFTPITYTITYLGLNETEIALLNNPTTYTIEDTFTLNNPADIVDANNEVVFKFVGWKDEKGNISLNVTIDKSTENKTFEPIWKKMKADIFSITYDLQGGEYLNSETNPNEYSSTTESFTLKEPYKEGYEFIGWTGSNGDVPQKNLEITKGTTGNLSFTANYSLINYSITYNLDDGIVNPENQITYTYLDTFTLTNPSKNGYEFDGWTGTDLINPTTIVTIPLHSKGDRVYTATYHAITYNINYILHGGTVSGTNKDTYTINDNFTLINPTKTGYTFTGWIGSNGQTPSDAVSISNETGNKEYEAIFTANTYSVIFDKNDSAATGTMYPQSFTYDEEKALSDIQFEKDGYEFTGWSTNPDGSGTSYTNKASVSNLATSGSITLYANWRKLTKATFKDGSTINARMKSIAGTASNIQKIKYASTIDPANKIDDNIVSIANESDEPIYMWWNHGEKTIYYYSDADVIYLNKTCSYMFNGITNVTDIDTHFNTSKCTNMEQMFYETTKLKNITLSTFDTSNVTSMRSMFGRNYEMPSFSINNWDVSKVKNFNFMFNQCYALTSLDLSNWNTESATEMQNMFSSMDNIESISIDNFDTKNVTNMKKMFDHAYKLKSLDLSSFDTRKAGSFEQFFQNSYVLSSLKLGPLFTIENATKTTKMFENTGLTTLDISMFNTRNVNTFNNMFDGAKLVTIYVGDDFVTTKQTSNPGMFTGAENLVGGAGTTYDSSKITKTYARVDDPDHGNPGYFTKKVN